ncbi:MAG: hypothetical protein CL490_06895 [Acinetobacter sp.]|nr:hypothetical protein [Acinetobacter sp.]
MVAVQFDSLEQLQDYATKWLWFYNHQRPHKASEGYSWVN